MPNGAAPLARATPPARNVVPHLLRVEDFLLDLRIAERARILNGRHRHAQAGTRRKRRRRRRNRNTQRSALHKRDRKQQQAEDRRHRPGREERDLRTS